MITTTYVFDEIVTFFNSRGRHAKAVEVGWRLLRSARVEIVHVEKDLFEAEWTYFQRRSDKRFSLTDCTSFVVMEQQNVQQALTFDLHFEQAGFKKLPETR